MANEWTAGLGEEAERRPSLTQFRKHQRQKTIFFPTSLYEDVDSERKSFNLAKLGRLFAHRRHFSPVPFFLLLFRWLLARKGITAAPLVLRLLVLAAVLYSRHVFKCASRFIQHLSR
jgi:hypothetical protein